VGAANFVAGRDEVGALGARPKCDVPAEHALQDGACLGGGAAQQPARLGQPVLDDGRMEEGIR
jgi:hypothetical protein